MSTDQQTSVHPPDRDECLGGPSPCSHACHNAPGRFSCSCPAGFALAKDGRNCKGEWAPGGEAPPWTWLSYVQGDSGAGTQARGHIPWGTQA